MPGIEKVEWLILENNQLQKVPRALLQRLTGLRKIFLDKNDLSDEELNEIFEFGDSRLRGLFHLDFKTRRTVLPADTSIFYSSQLAPMVDDEFS